MSFKPLAVMLVALGLGGCQSFDPVSQSPDPRFGEAVAWNKAVQIINPDPVYPPTAQQPGADGTRGAAAVDRYKKGTVKTPERMSTSSSGGGGGGGGSGGSGGGGG